MYLYSQPNGWQSNFSPGQKSIAGGALARSEAHSKCMHTSEEGALGREQGKGVPQVEAHLAAKF